MVKPLPVDSNLDDLKREAEDLLKACAAGDAGAAQRLREFHPRFSGASDAEIFDSQLNSGDARLVIACEYGFAGWARLERHIEAPTLADDFSLPLRERIEDVAFGRAVDLIDAGDVAALRSHLGAHSGLVNQRCLFEGGNYFRNPTLLEFAAENPIRRGTLPSNIVLVAGVILDAGAAALNETLELVCSGCVARECRVQLPLIELLCDRGADPNCAVPAALAHGEFEAVHALMRFGAELSLTVAAGLGRFEDARGLVARADALDRHRALALASLFGHVEIVRLLLDAGEDPNRYNPIGFHSHSTPLHQAALAGHDEVVRLLVERGARLDLKDIRWHGTPAGWAQHGGWTQLAEYLLSRR